MIITQNEEDRIGEAVRSAAFASEVVLVDGGSTDATVERARHVLPSLKVIARPFDSFARQWTFAIRQSTQQWFMLLAADEAIPQGLAEELLCLISREDVDAVRVGFEYWAFGRRLRYGSFRGYREIRCARRRVCDGMTPALVHEHLDIPPRARVIDARMPLVHHTYTSRDECRAKTVRYARLEASELRAQLASKGLSIFPFSFPEVWDRLATRDKQSVRECLRPLKNTRPSYLSRFLGPSLKFVYGYLLRLGFLDGTDGLFLSRMQAHYVHLKYRVALRGPDHTLEQSSNLP